MGVKKLDDLIAYQTAGRFKREVYRLVRASPTAQADSRFVDQLFDAASGVEACVAEGFGRFGLGEFRQFLRYAMASLDEAEVRLKDGIDRGHFGEADVSVAREHATVCRRVMRGLHRSLQDPAVSQARPNPKTAPSSTGTATTRRRLRTSG